MADPIENFNYVDGVNLSDEKFTPEQIIEEQSLVRQYLEDRYSRLDYSPVSGLHDLIVRPAAQMQLIARSFIEEFSKSRTLYDALKNEGNEKIVDAILSNFLVSRRLGTKSTGIIKVNVENYTFRQNISSSFSFATSDGLIFHPVSDQSFIENPTTTTEGSIFSSGAGTCGYFLIDVVASQVGERYNIQKNTQFTTQDPIDGLISIVAVENFIGGKNNESNTSVYNRIISSLSARNMTSALAIDQSLRDAFPSTILTVSHGLSSKYMKRNSHNVFGVKSGCFCDVYVKNSSTTIKKEVAAIASKIQAGDIQGDAYVGKFIVNINKDNFSGHYDILSVRPSSNDKTIGSYEILSKTRKFDNSNLENEIHTPAEAAFSKYSYTEVIFSELPESGLDEISVMCEVSGLENISEMQDFVNSGGSQSILIDTLIKACVPCFVSVGPIAVNISKGSSTSSSDISNAISDYILSVDPSVDKIRGDIIVSKILALDGVLGVDLPIKMTATIIVPSQNFETITIKSISSLEIPSIPSKFVGPETIGFFVEPDGITINVSIV